MAWLREEGQPIAGHAEESVQQAIMEIAELAEVLAALGCPAEKSAAMAAQLDKRARQLAAEKGRTHDEALAHLLNLMSQGWAAKEKGI